MACLLGRPWYQEAEKYAAGCRKRGWSPSLELPRPKLTNFRPCDHRLARHILVKSGWAILPNFRSKNSKLKFSSQAPTKPLGTSFEKALISMRHDDGQTKRRATHEQANDPFGSRRPCGQVLSLPIKRIARRTAGNAADSPANESANARALALDLCATAIASHAYG